MDPTSNLDLQAPASSPAERKRENRLRQAAETAVIWLHAQAERMDLVPTEFGDEAPVDRGDPRSLIKEWRRQARLWAGYNPEQVLALKAGAVALGVALLVLVALVGAIR
jgi:hypothetical protein